MIYLLLHKIRDWFRHLSHIHHHGVNTERNPCIAAMSDLEFKQRIKDGTIINNNTSVVLGYLPFITKEDKKLAEEIWNELDQKIWNNDFTNYPVPMDEMIDQERFRHKGNDLDTDQEHQIN